jgi:uncharacterized protein with PIN domain
LDAVERHRGGELLRDRCFDLLLHGAEDLEAVCGDQLEPVKLGRVMRGGNDEPELRPHGGDAVLEGRCREQAKLHDIVPGERQGSRDEMREPGARGPPVPSHRDRCTDGVVPGDGSSEVDGEGRSELLAHDFPDPVRPEQPHAPRRMRGEITLAESGLTTQGRIAPPAPAVKQWLVDEMLGKLARYLRILGCDAQYVRGVSDAEILSLLAGSHRRLVTRDELLAQRAPGATLLRAVMVREQLQELWKRHPDLPRAPQFTRCTLCNGILLLQKPSGAVPIAAILADASAKFRCTNCGHQYWRGSHTAHLERDLASWSGSLS